MKKILLFLFVWCFVEDFQVAPSVSSPAEEPEQLIEGPEQKLLISETFELLLRPDEKPTHTYTFFPLFPTNTPKVQSSKSLKFEPGSEQTQDMQSLENFLKLPFNNLYENIKEYNSDILKGNTSQKWIESEEKPSRFQKIITENENSVSCDTQTMDMEPKVIRTSCFFYDRAAYVVSDIYNSTSKYRNSIEQVFPWENKIDFMEIVEKLCEDELFDASLFFFYQAIIHAPSEEEAIEFMGLYKSYLMLDGRKEKVKVWIDSRIAQRISDTGKADGIQDLIIRIAGWILSSEKTESVSIEDMEKNHKKMEENYKKYDIPTNRTMSWKDSKEKGIAQDMLNLFSPHIFFRPYNKDLEYYSVLPPHYSDRQFEDIYTLNLTRFFEYKLKSKWRAYFLEKQSQGGIGARIAKFFLRNPSEDEKNLLEYAEALHKIVHDPQSLFAQQIYFLYISNMYQQRKDFLESLNVIGFNLHKEFFSKYSDSYELNLKVANSNVSFLLFKNSYFKVKIESDPADFLPKMNTFTGVSLDNTEVQEKAYPLREILKWEKEYDSMILYNLRNMRRASNKKSENLNTYIKLLESKIAELNKIMKNINAPRAVVSTKLNQRIKEDPLAAPLLKQEKNDLKAKPSSKESDSSFTSDLEEEKSSLLFATSPQQNTAQGFTVGTPLIDRVEFIYNIPNSPQNSLQKENIYFNLLLQIAVSLDKIRPDELKANLENGKMTDFLQNKNLKVPEKYYWMQTYFNNRGKDIQSITDFYTTVQRRKDSLIFAKTQHHAFNGNAYEGYTLVAILPYEQSKDSSPETKKTRLMISIIQDPNYTYDSKFLIKDYLFKNPTKYIQRGISLIADDNKKSSYYFNMLANAAMLIAAKKTLREVQRLEITEKDISKDFNKSLLPEDLTWLKDFFNQEKIELAEKQNKKGSILLEELEKEKVALAYGKDSNDPKAEIYTLVARLPLSNDPELLKPDPEFYIIITISVGKELTKKSSLLQKINQRK